ncbi:hypothetical protein FA15DRAFT_673724 [Coprinopsis marcescibilis]|uniref:Xylanolytic transcriptional activator regulatory domain-containing protein n=1 Tax=Coprinopsis marcescibilis TaxID=230819 RepID=A0A5C3KJT3_COPMA|nr:hypothetical protein FA15DRAFT_673724 [Coprinopsis marcescibilis]
MKCDFPRGENTCKRCKSAGHACVVEGRKPRTAPNKREYLLAQLRQKDVIIETLMKQVHNPYAATPLSIASYRMATSPSDTNNKSVLEWLDRLQSSVRDAGSKTGPQAFLDTRDKKGDEYSDHEDETQTEEQKDGDISDSEENPLSSEEKIQSSLPESHVPLGLIANLSLSNNKMSKSKKRKPTSKDAIRDAIAAAEEDYDDDNVGVANETYFMPGPATDLKIRATLIEQHSPPEILVHNLVTPKDVDNLFGIFYTRINPFVSLLDPVLHTPSSTFARCPFLFTVVCAISSRYYPEKSEIYPIAMHFAKHAAATALIDGWKSVELCQAYILMSIYAVPAMRWEEDRSWLYIGLAIRIATDLNLHNASTIKATSEKQEREILNKTRVWLICFNLDRSTATQFGKPSTIKEDYIVRNAKDWYSKSKYNHPYDIHLCAYSTLLQIVAKFHDEIFSDPSSPTGLNKRVDFRSVTLEHDRHLTNFHQEWLKKFGQESKIDDQGSIFRCSLLPFLVSYSRLVMFSFGFQQAFHRGLQDGDEVLFNKCLESAKAVLECMVDTLAPSGYMRYAPDGHFIFAAFASAFLLKLLRPEFSDLWKKEEELRVYELIGSLIKVLSSTKVAIDGRHTPNLYAKFLTALMTKHRKHDVPTVGRLQTQGPSGGHHVGGGGGAGGGPAPGGSGPSFSAPGPSGASGGVTGLASGGGPSLGSYGYASAPHPGSTTLAGDSHMMYMPENTFGIFNGRDFPMDDYAPGVVGTYPDEETLATMQAISNPAWWKDMMMPGFSWPDTSPSPPASGSSNPNSPPYHSGGGSGGGSNTMTSGSMDPSSYNDHYASNMPGSVGGKFGMFHAAYPPIQALH